MSQAILILLILLVLVLAGFIFSVRKKIAGSRKEELESKDEITKNISSQIQLLSSAFSSSLNNIQKSVDQRLGENTSRLDNASRSYGEVQKQIVHLQEEVKRVHEVGKDISTIHEILKAPKLRGVMGEFLLENLLSQIFNHENYKFQYTFKSGEKVDAIIRLKDFMIPVDSKFPLENFRKGSDSDIESEKNAHSRQFYMDVKKHIDSIAKKYILPDEGTVDFALMYIPAENVYHEIISQDFGELRLFDYAANKRVIPVSPNTLYAYISTILMGLKGMKIEENAKVILDNLKRLEIEFGKVRGDFTLLGTHLMNATKKYSDTEKRIDRFDSKLEKTGVKELKSEDSELLSSQGEEA